MDGKAHENDSGKDVRIVLSEPPTTPSLYATNLVVRHTKHEFIISFFEVRPPLLYGPSERKREQLDAVEIVEAPALARVVVAASRMPEFVQVLQQNLSTWQQSASEDEAEKESEDKRHG